MAGLVLGAMITIVLVSRSDPPESKFLSMALACIISGGMSNMYRILVVNPGSTSTKIAVFENGEEILKERISLLTMDLFQSLNAF